MLDGAAQFAAKLSPTGATNSVESGDPVDRVDPSPREHQLLEVLRTHELFDRSARGSARIEPSSLRQARSVWFGIGVLGRRPSRGLPVDVLALVFAQEFVRRALQLPRSEILIADTNALRAGAPPLEVHRAAHRIEQIVETLGARLRLPLRVVRASSLVGVEPLAERLRHAGIANPYAAEQLAQTELMRRAGATIKLGWVLSGATLDERYFDRLYRSAVGEPLSCVYTIGGRTLDPQRPRACPYVCERPDVRLLLDPRERVEAKLAPVVGSTCPARAGYRRLVGKLERAHQRLTHGPRPRELGRVLQRLVDHLPR